MFSIVKSQRMNTIQKTLRRASFYQMSDAAYSLLNICKPLTFHIGIVCLSVYRAFKTLLYRAVLSGLVIKTNKGLCLVTFILFYEFSYYT